MNAADFQRASIAILGSALGWQSAIARRLGIESRAVRRWMQIGEVPAWVEDRLAEMIGSQEISPWPRDEWIIGDGVTGTHHRREYIIHTAPPRFIARVVACDEDDGTPDPDEMPADVTSGTVYAADPWTALCEIEWIDPVPGPGEITRLMEAAADAIERQAAADQTRLPPKD